MLPTAAAVEKQNTARAPPVVSRSRALHPDFRILRQNLQAFLSFLQTLYDTQRQEHRAEGFGGDVKCE